MTIELLLFVARKVAVHQVAQKPRAKYVDGSRSPLGAARVTPWSSPNDASRLSLRDCVKDQSYVFVDV